MYECFVCMYTYALHVCPQRSEIGIRYSRTEPGPLEEHSLLLTIELSLQPQNSSFLKVLPNEAAIKPEPDAQ